MRKIQMGKRLNGTAVYYQTVYRFLLISNHAMAVIRNGIRNFILSPTVLAIIFYIMVNYSYG